nr:RecName: Full=Pregnancy-associated glycoprotein 55E; AltName: Full=EbPAG-E 55 kDa [Bison bonasus]
RGSNLTHPLRNI